jgi:glycerophosphoryl diester phosphodiesterase
MAAQNSAEALRAAADAGADWAEVDVRPTADGAIVLAHDETMGGLHVPSTPLDQLRKAHPPLATIKEGLAAARGLRGLDIELKAPIPDPGSFFDSLARDLAQWESELVLTSFFVPLLEAARTVMPEVELGVLTASSYDPDGKVAMDSAAGCSVVLPEHPSVSASLIAEAHREGKRVIAWTVNDADRIREFIEWGIDGIITDDVPPARRLVG